MIDWDRHPGDYWMERFQEGPGPTRYRVRYIRSGIHFPMHYPGSLQAARMIVWDAMARKFTAPRVAVIQATQSRPRRGARPTWKTVETYRRESA